MKNENLMKLKASRKRFQPHRLVSLRQNLLPLVKMTYIKVIMVMTISMHPKTEQSVVKTNNLHDVSKEKGYMDQPNDSKHRKLKKSF